MEATISAILTELAGRSISFLVRKYLNQQKPAPSNDERLDNLQRLLLRFRIIVDEAEERCITNQAMLEQLSILRKEMFRGHYTLDTFRCRAHQGKDHHGEVSSSFAISKFSPAKRIRFCSGNSNQSVSSELQRVPGNLENYIAGANEFIAFLSSCPRLHRQPYSMYLILDQCMFGRQMEMKYLINFLLRTGDHGTQEPGILPIIGPGRVGKSTLVEHACNDERVRNNFSQIMFFTRANLEDESIVDIRDGGCEVRNHTTSQITAPFQKKAYWYFFKVCTFGSMDASEYPEISSLAMEPAMESERSFMAANVFGRLLRSNTNMLYWRLVLASLREFKKKNQHIGSNASPPSQTEGSNISVLDVLLGGADQPSSRKRRFDALGWKSQIAPYYSYMYSCEIQRPMCMVARKKKMKRNGG
uniref:Rx N-terminal domain-containing protein n=1 Tax=Oryza glumipatula TaxID=40148 RepID=A0A0E0AF76_9ORYZ